ncbi:MAG: hypothetical protein EZS28_006801 [Streblomastix strix]|uniref:Uncharacterized protein n=1 Tax=Streblomastix strix TaxID=222440 RepID=A0A5J4WS96_9EUKA|nr:MAG: hypothetical protein EZS28_006801 [Streblomastix strix]
MFFYPAEFGTLIEHESLLSIASASLLFFTTESTANEKISEDLGQYKATLGVKRRTFDVALYGETRIIDEREAISIFDEKDKNNQPIILIRKDKGNEITAENPGVSTFLIPLLTLNSSHNKNSVLLHFNAESFNRIETVFGISLSILAFFTYLIQDYLVRIKRSPLPVAYKLKRKIKLRSSLYGEIVENTSYAFGIKFNCISGVITSSELLPTGKIFDKLNISGTKDDVEKRALKRAERRREEIVKQNEKRRKLEYAVKKGGLSEEDKRAQRKGVDSTIPSAHIVVAFPAITVEAKVLLEGEFVDQTIKILKESSGEIILPKKSKNQPQIAPKTIEQQLPPICIETFKIDDLQIDVAEILFLVYDAKTIDRLVSQKKKSKPQSLTFPASITNGPDARTFQELAEKLISRDSINEKANKLYYQTQYIPLVEKYCVWNFTKIEIKQSGEDPELKINAATIPGDFSITAVLLCGQTMHKYEVCETYTVAIDEFQLSTIYDNFDQFIKMAFEDFREAYRTHTYPRNTANTPKYRDTKMCDKITGDGQFNKEDFANIDLKSLRYQILSGIRGRVIGNGSVAQQEMLFAKVCFDTLVAHLEDEKH